MPITRVEYYEYIIPKKRVSPAQYFLEEEAQPKAEKRSHSQSRTYQPTLGLNRIPLSMALPMFRPRRIIPMKVIEIPPRPPRMNPMPPMEVLIQDRPRTLTHVVPRVHHGPIPYHMPHGTLPRYLPHGPVPHRMPHGPAPRHLPHGPVPIGFPYRPVPHGFPHRPVPHGFPHGPVPHGFPHRPVPQGFPHRPVPRVLPHGTIPLHLPHGPVPSLLPRFVKKKEKATNTQGRRFSEKNEEEQFTHIHPHPFPHPYQRYVYPAPQRRIEEFYADFEPEDMSVRSNYFIKRNKDNKTESDYDYGDDSYYTYVVNKPRKVISKRSVSQGRSNNLTFNLGTTQPRSMFIRIDNGRLNRTAQGEGNQTANIQTNVSYTQGTSNNGGKQTIYRYYQVKKTQK